MKAKSKINTLTSNQFYKGLNNRYDNRVKKLKKIGWKYDRQEQTWSADTGIMSIILQKMSNEFVYHADKRAFDDTIKRSVLIGIGNTKLK